jgi:hypothetical protein
LLIFNAEQTAYSNSDFLFIGLESPFPVRVTTQYGALKMLTKTKLVLAAALVLGAGSLAQASNENDGGNNTGGYVLPGNTDGVNPVYHPRWFPQYGRVTRAYDRANKAIYSGGGSFASYSNANSAYAFVPSATHHKSRSPR